MEVYMSKKHEYEIGRVYNLVKLKELYRNDKKRLMAVTECIKCHKVKYMRATDLFNQKANSCRCQEIII